MNSIFLRIFLNHFKMLLHTFIKCIHLSMQHLKMSSNGPYFKTQIDKMILKLKQKSK